MALVRLRKKFIRKSKKHLTLYQGCGNIVFVLKLQLSRWGYGGIGRRAWFRSMWGQLHAGSTPVIPTFFLSSTVYGCRRSFFRLSMRFIEHFFFSSASVFALLSPSIIPLFTAVCGINCGINCGIFLAARDSPTR